MHCELSSKVCLHSLILISFSCGLQQPEEGAAAAADGQAAEPAPAPAPAIEEPPPEPEKAE